MHIKIRRRKPKEALLLIVFVALLFQIGLQFSSNTIVSFVFNYIDEVIAAAFLIYIVFKLLSHYRLKPFDRRIMLSSGVFLIWGLIGSIVVHIQTASAVLLDFFTCAKFLIGYFGVRIWLDGKPKGYLRNNLNGICRFLAVIFFLLAVHDEFMTPFFPVGQQRYFGVSVILMFVHPTYLAAAGSVILIILAASNMNRDNFPYMLMISTVILLTFRTKAIAFVAVFWGLFILISVLKIRNKYIFMGFGVVVAAYLGYDQMMTYYFTTKWSARAVMLIDAFQLANRYFPFGVGYAGFGTNMSVRSYSAIYSQLGYNTIYGMGADNAAYLNDGLWQAVIGQFGWIGLVLFIWIIVLFLRIAFRFKVDRVGFFTYDAIISLNLFFIISSLGEMAYFAPFALLMFMIMAMIINENETLISRDDHTVKI